MKIQMLFTMVTEDDYEPLIREQWEEELHRIVNDVSHFIDNKCDGYVKDTDGEFILEGKGKGSYQWDRKNDELW